MKAVIAVQVDVLNESALMEARDKLVNALQDAKDSEEFAYLDFDVSEAREIETDYHAGIISLATEQYAMGSDNNVAIYDDARISESENGVWVEGYVFVHNDELEKRGLLDPAEDLGDEEVIK